jgi:inhibitor of cysteine peptidase
MPFFHYPSLAMVMLAMLFLTGCATQSDQQSKTTLAGSRENGLLVVTQDDNNRIAELQVGERLEISLPENPTTGFNWAVDENDRRILTLDDTAYIPPVEAGFIGARGQRIFTFTARQPGEVALKLKYWRFLGGDGSITERFGVTVRVVAATKT